MHRHILSQSIFTISDVLAPAECNEMVARANVVGFDTATINASAGPRIDKDARNNDRVIVDDFGTARRLWQRVGEFMPRMLSGRQVRGLNERLRFYRYSPGQKFSWHADAPFARENGELSLLTFMIYLNDGYEGGATRFDSVVVEGRLGMALVFEHGLIHEGSEVRTGTKYVLRSDVMFGPVGQFVG
jgi:prolyl 4-hydroxylase